MVLAWFHEGVFDENTFMKIYDGTGIHVLEM